MIIVSVQLRSANGSHRDRLLGAVAIANTGKGTTTRGQYEIALQRPQGRTRYATVSDFPRKQKSAFELLRRALNALYDQGQLP